LPAPPGRWESSSAPRLVTAGYEVVGVRRTPSKDEVVRKMGASPVVADALEPEEVARAVGKAQPEVIVHQLTSLPGSLDMRHFDRDFDRTNRSKRPTS
jgi:nucleoside-diphosphate-sugar epimerase